jgi:fumarate hydratase class I
MLKLRDGVVELYKKVANSIPPDVEDAIRRVLPLEDNPVAKESLSRMLDTIRSSRQASRPVCLDTGIPTFKIKIPKGLSHTEIRNTVREATVIATKKVPLNQNAVDILTGENSGDNTGLGFPVIYLEETAEDTLTIDLMLRGSECENYGQTYALPSEELNAGRDLEGVRKSVLHCVQKAQGKGCPPYSIGIGIGAAKDQVTVLAKYQLFRKLTDTSEFPVIAALESRLMDEINHLGIGPMGLGGRTTTLGVKIGINHRSTESFIIDVSLCCWANRRGRLIW